MQYIRLNPFPLAYFQCWNGTLLAQGSRFAFRIPRLVPMSRVRAMSLPRDGKKTSIPPPGTSVRIRSRSTNSWHLGRTGGSEVPGRVTICYVLDGKLAVKHAEPDSEDFVVFIQEAEERDEVNPFVPGEPTQQIVQPAPGPGNGVTPTDLAARWAAMPEQAEVVAFFGEGEAWGCFSNFYSNGHDFEFVVPQELFAAGFRTQTERTVKCAFAEKAVMLCKAAVMGDDETFALIVAASTPDDAKKLGRAIKGFSQALWDEVVCSVAFEVIFQKFQKQPEVREVLLMTADAVLAETSPWDGIWGIKMAANDPRVRAPSQWQGTNILGWALMEARSILKG